MNFLQCVGCIAILTMQFSFASFGQAPGQAAKKTKQPDTPRVDIVQILDRARRLSDDARSLEPADEIPLQARLADAVWDFDQSLAERVLTRSLEVTIALLKDMPRSDASSNSTDPQLLFAYVSSLAAKHDEVLEKKLRERWQAAIAQKSSELKSDPAQMANLLLWQANTYLKNDESKARQLFRQSVALRVVQEHCWFLVEQRKQTPELTDTLFGDTLDVLAQRPLADANEVLMLSSYLFSPNGYLTYVTISGYNAANVTANMSAVPKNAALAKRYLRLLLAKVTANELTPPAVAHLILKNLLPQYQSLAPELLDDVYAQMATLLPGVSKEDAANFDYAQKDSNASEPEQKADWDKRIEKADKLEKEDWRDFEYYNLLFGYLLPSKDFARALIMVGKISSQDLREKCSDVVNVAALQARLDKPETAASVSESDLNRIKHPLARVVGLSHLGQARLKQKATGDALRLFGEAAAEANHINDDQNRLQAKLLLVQLSVDADSATAFQTAAQAFKEINQFQDFKPNRGALSLRAFVYRFDQELDLISPAPASLWSTVEKLCRTNCDETFQTIGRLEKKELRLWAYFMAVQTTLRDNAKQPSAASH